MTTTPNTVDALMKLVDEAISLAFERDLSRAIKVKAAVEASARALAAVPAEPDMRHPKIQALIGSRARCQIALQLVEEILENPRREFTSMDMEHWDGMHDKLMAALDQQAGGVPAGFAQIVAKMRLDLDGVGGFENGMISVPAEGVRTYIERLEALIAAPSPSAVRPTVEQAIVQLVEALVQSKGWLHAYADSVVRDAIDRKEAQPSRIEADEALMRQARQELELMQSLYECDLKEFSSAEVIELRYVITALRKRLETSNAS